MTPMSYEQYRAHVGGFLTIARGIREESPDMSDERLADELHEWISAPDSFFHWHDGKTEDVALDVLRHSANRYAGASDGRGQGVVTPDEVNYEYLAAWSFVWDVLDALHEEQAR